MKTIEIFRKLFYISNYPKETNSNHMINRRILLIIIKKYPEFKFLTYKLNQLIDKYPSQRFGQIVCNYVFPYYKEDFNGSKFFKNIFPYSEDPFYEKPLTTLKNVLDS